MWKIEQRRLRRDGDDPGRAVVQRAFRLAQGELGREVLDVRARVVLGSRMPSGPAGITLSRSASVRPLSSALTRT